jgi:hypothetical protein
MLSCDFASLLFCEHKFTCLVGALLEGFGVLITISEVCVTLFWMKCEITTKIVSRSLPVGLFASAVCRCTQLPAFLNLKTQLPSCRPLWIPCVTLKDYQTFFCFRIIIGCSLLGSTVYRGKTRLCLGITQKTSGRITIMHNEGLISDMGSHILIPHWIFETCNCMSPGAIAPVLIKWPQPRKKMQTHFFFGNQVTMRMGWAGMSTFQRLGSL